MQSLKVFPGMDKYDELGEDVRQNLMEAILASVTRWDDSWQRLRIQKVRGNEDILIHESPLHYWLRTRQWFGVQQRDGDTLWCRPSDRWHVPAAMLSVHDWRFAHLRPLPGELAHRIDRESALAATLSDLGMPVFDVTTRTPSTRLLDALALAIQKEEVRDWNFVLGQVRDAWAVFYPKVDSSFP